MIVKNSNLSVISFSKNRAMQLDLLFQSIKKNASNTFGNITIIYTASNEDYLKGYEILKKEYPLVTFIFQDNFEQCTREAISKAKDYLIFLVDDDVIYAPISGKDTVHFLKDEEVCCVGFRLGLNISYSYAVNQFSSVKNYTEIERNSSSYISFNWREQAQDFSYPLSLSAHAFRKSMIENLVSTISFEGGPNWLEINLQSKKDVIPNTVVSPINSSIVNIPVNIVSEFKTNRCSNAFSVEILNNMFLEGKRIDLDKMDFNGIVSAHQEIGYEFK